ncbi:hypothetical protein M9458_007523 [Cirrhinus mrigala]|uniref:AIG1-type G domain-containing protein n=1 Tax=Cirrhinus mrigala TaxID=683832 RepID=A0ABD0RKB5_CIRMR
MKVTEEDQQILQMIEMLFGEEVLKYSIILFSYGDWLDKEPIEKFIKQNSALSSVVQQCGGRFHVFDNKNKRKRKQVNDLLQKIDTMIEQNGDALRFTQEEDKRRKKGLQEK